MKKILFFAIFLTLGKLNFAQRLLSWTPEFSQDNSTMVITVDCSKGNQGLFNYANTNDVYVHLGVNTNLSTGPTDWKYVKFPNFNAPTPAAQATSLGNNRYSYTITNIRSFFGVPAGETINKVNVIFRNGNGSLKNVNSDGSDMYIPVYAAGQYAVRLNLPPFEPRFVPFPENITATVGSTINIAGVASNGSALTIKLNGTTVNTASGATSITASPTITTNCEQKIVLEGNDGTGLKKDSFSFFIPPASNVAPLPAGAIEGINYLPGNTSATLVLFAPNKTTVNLIGEFTSWAANCSNIMNKTPDGNYYWLTVTGLVPGQEYAYQYLVDNTIKTADPYTQKILDPNNDQFITAVTYPNLKPYPTGLTTGLVGILQTVEPAYPWQVTNFAKPDKRNLIIYELLLRDFLAQHSYQSLIDSIQYLKGTGINAIELMPVNEFDNNESWGYNPSFYFAPDKYYGTKNKLKEFIDVCHQNGIAVILDVVYNHCTGEAPQAKMYWNSSTNQPTPNNPWLNVTAPHPYSVFNDFNHTLATTRYLFQRNLKFWIEEYKIDGFRFDLAKGFTQTPTNTTTVENYDPSRVANLKYYYDQVIPTYPSTYMILEFLGSTPSQEEQEYVSHGFMMWGNMNTRWSQNTMGFASNSDLSANVYNSSQRNFSNPAGLIGYMQSHDEERTMYRNLQFGNSNGSYDVKQLNTALEREEAAAAIYFCIPGPKMIWQFEERGYDISINFGGSNVANKPPLWNYMDNPNRRKLYNLYNKVISFRLANQSVFNNTTFNYNLFDGGGLVRSITIDEPIANGKRVVAVANFDVTTQTRTFNFQGTGTWTNFVSNGTGTGLNGATNSTFNLTNTSQSITLAPGEYHIYFYTPPCNVPAPTVTTPLSYCQNTTAPALTATGTGLLWYSSSTGGTGSPTAPVPSTSAAGSTTYYVSQTVGPCESPRASIVVNITAATVAPTVVTPVNYCQNATATQLTATGTSLLWYTVPSGGTGSATAPTPVTTAVGNTTYYVSQTGTCGEGPRAAIVVNVIARPSAPSVTSPIGYCQNATATPLTATGTNLLWYTVASGGTGSSTAITPSTTASGSTTYYVSQTANGCEGPRASIVVNITATPAAPTVTTPITYCQNTTATALTATGSNLLWYATATGGTGSSTAPTPITTTIGNTTYYVSQTINGCEGPRASISVNVVASTPAPTVTSPVNYCQNATAAPLTATGSSLLWYIVPTGGTGSSTAPTPSTTTLGSTTYYVSQTLSCGEGPRAAIMVNINPIPTVPTIASSAPTCAAAGSSSISNYNAANTYVFTPSGPTVNATGAISGMVFGTSYTVAASQNSCSSASSVTFSNSPQLTTPAVPTINSVAATCAAPGTSTISNYSASNAYTFTPLGPTVGAGGIINGMVIGTSYTVTAGLGFCTSASSFGFSNAAIIPTPGAPGVSNPAPYCQGSTATPLTATGINLLWYNTLTGGTGSATAPIPNTTNAGTQTFYVSQTVNTCEGPRATITVTVNPTPAAPTAPSPINYCQNATATPLTASGSNLLWFTVPTGGTSSSTAPTPSTATAGSTSFYVSQTVNGCASPRATIVVNVTATPAAPTVTSPVTYCQNATAVALTANGTGLLWFANPTGGTGSATAPTPSTAAAGSTNYYVAQSNSCGEGARATIVVNVNATPAAPTNLNVTNVTLTSATLNWTGIASSFYTVEYKLANATAYTVAATGVQTTSAIINNLVQGGSYQFRVSANCEATGLGNSSAVFNFSTLNRNNTITTINNGLGIKISPNPISQTGIVDYLIPENGNARLEILDRSGKTVLIIALGNQTPGQYFKNINGQLSPLASGTYYMRLIQNDKSVGMSFVKYP
jgi:1,4-alpha-glucan branching enzyme